ncbi:MAG: hypothetical protein J4F43_01195 [Dehalococcoidia bacterium]|nr:hypothetical protein [Dehalococcoidia bacterium]
MEAGIERCRQLGLLGSLAETGYDGLAHPEHFEDTGRRLQDPEAGAVKIIGAWTQEAGG